MNFKNEIFFDSLRKEMKTFRTVSETTVKNTETQLKVSSNPVSNIAIDEAQHNEISINVDQIYKLHEVLEQLEIKCGEDVAEKYLNGFLEYKGMNSFDEFINSFN